MRSPSSLLNQSIEFQSVAGVSVDDYGNPDGGYVTALTLPARVEARNGRIDFGGRWVEFRGWRAYLDGAPAVTVGLRARYDGIDLEVVWVDPQPDRDGTTNHTVVWLAEAQ